ncbi:hypothetical protein KP77_11300 [Jeotgalibacillus alimentarius]|uniref:Uncharacterized protein n=1 Tax=Jeotgalibacillus alimentarius TaxID=135826 RepID=A0A0C2W6G8_9BACL|nr:hypothetical protein [Jeotgalibacillus alimentarius]KIL51618.1 hypothetical protein KP77_11300 [Jeotgalibacillus alimentarius]
MLQVSNAEQGLIVTDNFMSEEVRDFGFAQLNMVTIKAGTPAFPNFEKSNQGIPLEDLPLFGVSVIHDEPIDRIDIEYRHFGLTYKHTVYFD